MKYVIKIGAQYLGTDGNLVSTQRDALRVDVAVKDAVSAAVPLPGSGIGLRLVRLRPSSRS